MFQNIDWTFNKNLRNCLYQILMFWSLIFIEIIIEQNELDERGSIFTKYDAQNEEDDSNDADDALRNSEVQTVILDKNSDPDKEASAESEEIYDDNFEVKLAYDALKNSNLSTSRGNTSEVKRFEQMLESQAEMLQDQTDSDSDEDCSGLGSKSGFLLK